MFQFIHTSSSSSSSSSSHQSPGSHMNSCQLTKSVRQARRSWYIFWDITSCMLDPFSLSWLSMLFSHLVLYLHCGHVPFNLKCIASWNIECGYLLMRCHNHNYTLAFSYRCNSSSMSAFRILSLLVTPFISRRTVMAFSQVSLQFQLHPLGHALHSSLSHLREHIPRNISQQWAFLHNVNTE